MLPPPPSHPPPPGAPPGKRYYLFGYPVAHSAAPRFHNVCFDSEGIDSRYELWSTSRVTHEMIEVMKRDETGGAAVTMPLKSAITEYLDEVTTESFITGACNTVVKTRKDGGRVRLVGTNTDFLGIRNSLVSALRSQHPSRPIGINHRYPAGQCSGAIIGGGATTRSAVYALWTLGMNPIFIVNRDPAEAEAIKRNFEGLKEVEGLEIVHLRSTQEVDLWLGGEEAKGGAKARTARAPGVAMIVGAIPAIHPVTLSERLVYAIVTHILTLSGVFPSASVLVHSETPLDPHDPHDPHNPHDPGNTRLALPLPTRRIFLEMPYKPRLTPLLQIATALGWHPVGGIDAMIEQGLAQQRMWRAGDASLETGCSDLLDPETERRAREVIVDMEDIVPLDPEIDRGLKM